MDASARDRIVLRTPDEIARISAACAIVHDVLDALERAAVPGVTTAELDRLAREHTRAAGAEPAFLGYHGYPAALCISVNDEVVHGIPSPTRRLAEGDVVGLDFGVVLAGWYGDAARTVAAARPGATTGDIGAAVQRWVEGNGYSVVRDFVGHGIGRRLHEPPHVPNYGEPGKGERLRPGTVLALEPMVNAGTPEVEQLDDGWTAVTADGSLSSHFEHTVAVTENGPVVLGLAGRPLIPSGDEPKEG